MKLNALYGLNRKYRFSDTCLVIAKKATKMSPNQPNITDANF